MQIQQRIIPFLSFTNEAKEAAEYYVSVFPDARMLRLVSNPADGKTLTAEFELFGMRFVALNAGQNWKFTEATSFEVMCDTQAEIDHLWERLVGDGGRELACAWLQDKFGVFWQIVPAKLSDWLASEDAEMIQRMWGALWEMKKLDIAALQAAFDGD